MIVVVVVYILICLGCIWHYWTKRRSEFNWLLHGVLPTAGAVLFFFPLYYEYVQVPADVPDQVRELGRARLDRRRASSLTFFLYARYPDRLRDMERVYVEDETVHRRRLRSRASVNGRCGRPQDRP